MRMRSEAVRATAGGRAIARGKSDMGRLLRPLPSSSSSFAPALLSSHCLPPPPSPFSVAFLFSFPFLHSCSCSFALMVGADLTEAFPTLSRHAFAGSCLCVCGASTDRLHPSPPPAHSSKRSACSQLCCRFAPHKETPSNSHSLSHHGSHQADRPQVDRRQGSAQAAGHQGRAQVGAHRWRSQEAAPIQTRNRRPARDPQIPSAAHSSTAAKEHHKSNDKSSDRTRLLRLTLASHSCVAPWSVRCSLF